MSTEVSTTGPAPLPSLADTPASAGSLDGSDAKGGIPRLYRGEFQSAFVQEGLCPSGSIFTALGGDDPEPEILVERAVDLDKGEGVLIHILDAWKNVSYQYPKSEGGQFRTWAFGDPDAHPEAKVGYQYYVALPEDAPGMPVKLTLAKTSRKCGERINFRLLSHDGPMHELAFRLSLKAKSAESDGQKFKWFVWQERYEDADAANVADAEDLARLVQGMRDGRSSQPAGKTAEGDVAVVGDLPTI